MRLHAGRAGFAATLLAASPAFAGTMPQLDFANPLLKAQVIWGAVIFAGLYLAIGRVGLPQVAEVLVAREAKIGGDLEAARLSKGKADRAIAELNAARSVAFAEAQAALAAATQRAKEDAAAKAAEVNARLDSQLEAAEQNIAAARAGAMASLREAASDTADMLISRLAGRPAPVAVVRAAVGQALAARGIAGA